MIQFHPLHADDHAAETLQETTDIVGTEVSFPESLHQPSMMFASPVKTTSYTFVDGTEFDTQLVPLQEYPELHEYPQVPAP